MDEVGHAFGAPGFAGPEGGGGPGWGGLLSAITWQHYLYYGDRAVLKENYDAIRRYVDYLESLCKGNVLRKFGGKWDFIGDWVPPRRGMDTKNWPKANAAELFNNCYRINQMHLLKQMATALGKSADVERYSKRLVEIRPAVHAAFYDTNKQQYVIDEQAYYVMPLMTDVVPEALRPLMLKKLEKKLKFRIHMIMIQLWIIMILVKKINMLVLLKKTLVEKRI